MPADDRAAGGGLALLTPPPGDPAGIRSVAEVLRRRGADIGDAAAAAGRSGGRLVADASWQAGSAQAYLGATDLLRRGLGSLELPTTDVGAACTRFADALDQAQRDIRDAATRHAGAQAAADRLASAVNADPDRTPAEVAAAQARIDGYASQMRTAVDDASRAWAAYREAEQAQIAAIGGAARALEVVPPLDELYRLLEDLNVYTDGFGNLWEIAWSYASVRNLAAALQGTEGPVQSFESLLEGVRAGHAASPAAVAAASSELAGLQGEIAGLQALRARGLLSAAEAARLETLEARLPAAIARLESAMGGARSFAQWSRILGGLSKVVTGVAVFGDVMTLIDPPHDGAWGVVDRVAAGGNLVGLGIGAVAATGWGSALLAGTAIPVVGQVLVVGTGLYLAGSWLYDNWEPFHDVVDGAVDGIVDAAQATGEFLGDVGEGIIDAGEGIIDGLSDAGGAISDGLGAIGGALGGLFD